MRSFIGRGHPSWGEQCIGQQQSQAKTGGPNIRQLLENAGLDTGEYLFINAFSQLTDEISTDKLGAIILLNSLNHNPLPIAAACIILFFLLEQSTNHLYLSAFFFLFIVVISTPELLYIEK